MPSRLLRRSGPAHVAECSLDLALNHLLKLPVLLLLRDVRDAILLSLGLWKLWSWAWTGTIVLQFIAAGFALYDWFTGVGIDFLAIAIAIFIVLYLLRSEVRAAFFT